MIQVCLSTNHLLWNTTLGGHAWVFLNWALGLQASGARVVVLEKMRHADHPELLVRHLHGFRSQLGELGLRVDVALLETPEQAEQLRGSRDALEPLLIPVEELCASTDVLLNFRYGLPQDVVDRFSRSALLDIDPGLLQTWMAGGQVAPATHDLNFTIGETVGTADARFPDGGTRWHFSPPPVYLPAWPVVDPVAEAPFTTVTNWWGEYELLGGQSINNEKRTHFLKMIELPSLTKAPLELAIYHEDGHSSDMPELRQQGWAARPASEVSATALDYRAYIQRSRGEFSCAKESCMVLQNAWISDRTLCYLASGRPAVVQHTGPSRFLPDAEGLFRFKTMQQAARYLDALMTEDGWREHGRAARALAETHFDATKVLTRLLATAMEAKPRSRRG